MPDNDQPSRVEQLGTYEMIWDCKFCGTKNQPAKSHKFCSMCGAAQDPDTRRFPSDAEKIAIQNYEHKGANLICAACGTPNEGDSAFCMQCGAPLENAARAATISSETRAESEAFTAGTERDLAAERMTADLAASAPPPKRRVNWIAFAIIAIGVLVVIGIVVALTWKRSETVVVTGHEWQRVIAIEAFTRLNDGAWCDQMPGDAYSVSRDTRQRDTRQVPDGETCSVERVDNGDGSFSEQRVCRTNYRDEPVYDDYCTFNVNRWVNSRDVTASGSSLSDAPVWPAVSLSSGTSLGSEREGGRSEEYVVILTSGDTRVRCTVPQRAWENAGIEEVFEISIGVITGAPDCSPLEE
jgi:hypothetical protein